MTTLLYYRHCETAMNVQPHLVSGRSNDTPPTKRGLEQAEKLGDYLAHTQVETVAAYSSGALRADTTGSVALARGGLTLPLVRDERLLELSQGAFEGKPRRDVYTTDVVAQLDRDGMNGRLPGGESFAEVQARMHDMLRDVSKRYPDGTILVFSHGLAIRALAGAILGYDKQQILHDLVTDNVSETRIEIEASHATVIHVGKTVIDSVD